MKYDLLGPEALDYLPCRYGTSKLLFRGPRRCLDDPFVAFLGGTETYGKFIDVPFPARLEKEIGMTCVNFGQVNAGIDAFAHDPFVMGAAAKADVTVVQIVGAQNMTNRFYAVHPRRNDRFITTSALLRTIYREVDFADFHYTKHMLNKLLQVSPDRFETVRQELQQAWLARMRLLLKQVRGKSVLFWFADHAPQSERNVSTDEIGNDPLFISREMMDDMSSYATSVVECVPSAEALSEGTDDMFFSEMEKPAAEEVLGPLAHAEAAEALATEFERLV
ncbi:MAG: hypothetical protein HKN30_17440 [Sulfitobacter sp.]|nr:hypothetical protein [Sulfitobacter sp.]